MKPISEDLYEMLVRQGIEAGSRAGTRKLARKMRAKAGTGTRGIKGRDAAIERAVSPVKADAGGKQQPTGAEGGQRGPIYLAWVNTAMRQGTRRRTGVPFLMIVSSR